MTRKELLKVNPVCRFSGMIAKEEGFDNNKKETDGRLNERNRRERESEALLCRQRERNLRAAEQTTRKKKTKANVVYLKKKKRKKNIERGSRKVGLTQHDARATEGPNLISTVEKKGILE